jgi:hypothetical protein
MNDFPKPASCCIGLLALVCLAACSNAPARSPVQANVAAQTAAVAPGAGRHIKPLAITISPESVALAPGASATFSARPSGGEAIRLMIDWTIREGQAGGKIVPVAEQMNGAATVTYTAPASGGGPYHLVASLRQFPAVQAVATISIP